MSLKSPFLKGLQEEMRMRGYSIRTGTICIKVLFVKRSGMPFVIFK
ncbi:hypothetical protein DET48_1385 [Vibrio diazotrophicus]|uniref:Uncharacterized protein n=1 Tax=Vibrio diazotrophicus TaxID=685 RepID=A0A329DZW9_VIBDI|nr:hypothetical protein [Vibrio diazotrophicus]RAS57070.1 hypothetical protein DET48_1385 [Vibrio diazotrophicus]